MDHYINKPNHKLAIYKLQTSCSSSIALYRAEVVVVVR